MRQNNPARSDHRGVFTGVSVLFEVTEEDGSLVGGGTVTTHYNENDQPLKTLVRDTHGEMLTRIEHTYDAQGRLVGETLVRESFEFPEFMIPEQYREQFTDEQPRATIAQMTEMLSQREGLKGAERSYVYDDQDRVIKRELRMGSWCQSMTTTYNEHGNEAGVVTIQTGSFDPKMERSDERLEVSYLYQYDSHGNWTQQTISNNGFNSDKTYAHHRKLTYY